MWEEKRCRTVRAYEYRKTIFGTTKDGREVTAYTLQHSRNACEDQQSRSGNRIVEMKDFMESARILCLDMTKYRIMKNGTFFGAAVGRGQTGQKAPDLCWMGQSITFRKMSERITCTVDRTVMRSASGIV